MSTGINTAIRIFTVLLTVISTTKSNRVVLIVKYVRELTVICKQRQRHSDWDLSVRVTEVYCVY